MGLTGNWRVPFLTTGLLGLLVGVLLLLCWPAGKETARSGRLFDQRIFKSSSIGLLVLLSLVFAFQIAAEFGFTMWYPAFLELEMGMTTASAGLMAGLFGLGQFLGRPAMGWLSDRVSYRIVGTGCGIIMGLLLILILSVMNESLRGLFTLQAGFIGAGVMGVLWTFTGLAFPSFKGLALGIITTGGYALASAAPILIGHLGDHHTIGVGLWLICVPASFLASVTFLATFLIKPSLRKKYSRKISHNIVK
jgi:NNP family nitrate/nitrite transporter-like MFS transporter